MDRIDAVHDDDVGGTGLGENSAAQKPESRNPKPETNPNIREWVNEREERAAVRGMLCKLAESAPAGAALGRAPALAWAGLRLAAMVLLAAGVGIGLGDGDEFDDVGCSVAQKPEGGKACRGKAEMLTRLRVASARQEGETLPSEAAETSRAEESGDSEEPSLSLAAKVFELLTALDPDSRLRKAPPIKVFLLRFRQNLSRAEIGRICHCDKSLVGVRLKTIQDKLP